MKFILALILALQSVIYAAKPVNLEYYIHVQVPKSPETSQLRYRLVIPTNIEKRQAVKIEYTVPPTKVFDDKGTRYAEWQIADLKKATEIGVTIKTFLYQADMSSLRKTGARLSAEELKKYTSPEKWVESDHAEIGAALGKIRSHKSEKVMVERILNYVTKTMKYSGYNSNDMGAVASLTKKQGDCNEYTDLFVALCRARGIPARSIAGVSANWKANDTPKHSRAEVFLVNYGWVPIDPLWSDIDIASFRKTPSFLQMSTKRVDPVLGNFYYWGCTYVGDDIQVKTTIKLLKSSVQKKLPQPAVY